MKTRCVMIVLASGMIGMACMPKKKISYAFPAEMAEPIRVEYAKLCDKGQILYAVNCAPCHRPSRRSPIPNFTSEQLESYQVRVSNARHESQLTEAQVSAEELGLIITFLTYKTPN